MAQVGPKMGQEGGKMGTKKGREGAREAQVGPRSGQKKRDPKLKPFWNHFEVHFGVLVGPPAVIRGLLEALIFWTLFWDPSRGRQNLKKWISADMSFKNRRADVSKKYKKGSQNWEPRSKEKGSGRRFGETKTGPKNVSKK